MANEIKKKPMKKAMLIIGSLFLMMTLCVTIVLANYRTVKIEANVVNVRIGPGLSYDIMAQVSGGETVNVLAEKNEWYKVRLSNDKIGWIAKWLIDNTEISPATNMLAKIDSESANIRQKPTTKSKVIGKLPQGSEVTVMYQENGWSQVQYKSQISWVNSSLLKITGKAPQVTPEKVEAASTTDDSKTDQRTAQVKTLTARQDNTHIRMGPSIDRPVIETIQEGDNLEFLGRSGEWYYVKTASDKKGYVANWTVDLSTTNQSAPIAKASSLPEATIVIDPGHGGSDPGSRSIAGYDEKEITLETAQVVRDRLKAAGANVIMTRNNDTLVELGDIAKLSNKMKADAFISIHFDSSKKKNSASGTTTYYYHKRDKPLASVVNKYLKTNLSLENRGISFGDFQVTRENKQPALLLELGYINNGYDSKIINTDKYRSQVAESIYQALNEYFQY